MVSGDSVRLEQIASNLITNALKYAPYGGHVGVAVTVESDSARLVVEDDGVGIATQMLPRIFDALAQSEQSLARSQGGMGVGLTLVDNLVRLHDGTITANSQGVGQGSRFEVSIPLLSEQRIERQPVTPEQTLGDRTVVLIDDQEDVRLLLADALKSAGYAVEVATDGEAGVRLIERVRPDIAIVDIGLPGMSGYEVARRVRRSLGRDIRLIAFTGYGQPADRERTQAAGFDHHLTKPLSLDAVFGILAGA